MTAVGVGQRGSLVLHTYTCAPIHTHTKQRQEVRVCVCVGVCLISGSNFFCPLSSFIFFLPISETFFLLRLTLRHLQYPSLVPFVLLVLFALQHGPLMKLLIFVSKVTYTMCWWRWRARDAAAATANATGNWHRPRRTSYGRAGRRALSGSWRWWQEFSTTHKLNGPCSFYGRLFDYLVLVGIFMSNSFPLAFDYCPEHRVEYVSIQNLFSDLFIAAVTRH